MVAIDVVLKSKIPVPEAIAFEELKKSCNLRERLRVDSVARRVELLKLEGLGFSQAEVVNKDWRNGQIV